MVNPRPVWEQIAGWMGNIFETELWEWLALWMLPMKLFLPLLVFGVRNSAKSFGAWRTWDYEGSAQWCYAKPVGSDLLFFWSL